MKSVNKESVSLRLQTECVYDVVCGFYLAADLNHVINVTKWTHLDTVGTHS